MTLDEDPDNKRGPWMLAKFFAGTRDTHFGQVMFECDRLMKCLGQGKDNITKEDLRPKMAGFHTQAEISLALNEERAGAVWDRFWANLATGRFPANDLRGKPLVEVSSDHHTIWFAEHRIFVDTEQMLDPGKGHRLASSGGRQSRSALAFADQLTARYDELAKEFSAFHSLHELSKLVVLAEWVREAEIPIDPELLHCRLSSGTTTPTRTPSLSTTNAWQQGNGILQIYTFGGVTLEPGTKYVTAKEKHADPLAVTVEQHRAELRAGEVVRMPSPDAQPKLIIPFGPSARGPPDQDVTSGTRSPPRAVEVQGRLRARSREADDPVLGRFEMPVWTDAATGHQMLNLPVLRAEFSARHSKTATFRSSDGRSTEPVKVPDRVYVTSPLRDIHVCFEKDPGFDEQRAEPYFPALAKEVAGYYPRSRAVRMKDGTEYRFSPDGLVEEVQGPGKPHVKIEHRDYRDGPLTLSTVTPSTLPRGPPIRQIEPLGRPPPISREADVPSSAACTRLVVRNIGTGRSLEVRDDGGRLFFVQK